MNIPKMLLTDSYKAGHFEMYPPDIKSMYAYGEFRKPLFEDDHRIVFYGLTYLVETYLNKQWTANELFEAKRLMSNHYLGSQYPFPEELLWRVIKEYNGYIPIRVLGLPEGSVVQPHTPVYVIEASGDFARLVTYFESLLTKVWYTSAVATLSAHTKELIRQFFDQSVDDSSKFLLDSRLHDFGYRGCTSEEQAMLGGSAHLLSFTGTDTLSAAWYAHRYSHTLFATSIPATEHSVMMSWPSELQAVQNMVDKYGHGVFATVADTYDYRNFLNKILPVIAPQVKAKGGTHIVRPDSGDPVDMVMLGLEACAKHYGYTTNNKGYMVLNNSGVIQGDGIDYQIVKKILEAATAAGYSAQNLAFGMGGGLLQKVNRDTLSFATKLSFIQFEDHSRDLMKKPKTDGGKISLPGKFRVHNSYFNESNCGPIVTCEESTWQNNLVVYYDGVAEPGYPDKRGYCESFNSLRDQVARNWKKSPKIYNPISSDLKLKIDNYKVPT
jgi:nicotinamide phosphoribosyltransferase